MPGRCAGTCLAAQDFQTLNSIQVTGVQLAHGTGDVLLAATQAQLRLTTVGPLDTLRHSSTHEAG